MAEDITYGNNEFDLLIFTQQWPVTACFVWTQEGGSCTLPQPGEWTVHGVWPTRIGSMGPAFCNRTWPYDASLVRPIRTQLKQYWTNIENGTPEDGLWSHEWSKHGTCAAIIPELAGELQYFGQGLLWLQEYEMQGILAKAGIQPGTDSRYSVSDIYQAIKQQLGKNPAIRCVSKSGDEYIGEIRICFDKQLNLADCDGIVQEYDDIESGLMVQECKSSKMILYPSIVPSQRVQLHHNWLVGLFKFVNWLQWLTL